MDKWIADNIDQEVEDGRAIRNNYNQSRRLSRIQTFSMNKHVASSREDHLSFEDLFTHMDDEPMEVNETSSVLSNQSAYDANVIDPMNNSPDESDSDSGDNDDDDDDDSIYMLDSFDESESSEDETEDNEEQRYLTTANDQLHSYTANKTSDVCIQLLKSILVRLYDEINGYKKQILKESEEVNKQSNDIPFASCYQNLLNYDNNFISLLFHIDGIGLFKSSKLKLWLFSTSIIELPPRLRYKRCNLPVVSVWVGYKEPNIHMWLDKSIIVGSVPVKYNIFHYGIIADCPALALILNFINHTGYFCCFYCFIRGQHDRRCRKRQYIYSDTVCTRDPTSFNNHSHSAESNKLKVYGHRGRSILDEIIDVPLPHSIICDYQHVTLLRHFRDVMKAISCSLPTKVRKQIEQKLVKQAFPNFFHRKMRGIENLSFIKATELKNLLFYGFIPNFYKILPIDQAAHMCLFICGIRLLHTSPYKISSSISTMADELLKTYYKHHSDYYKFLANFVLHLHSHFAEIYQRHGSLTYINTFSQEDFIG
ncbi:unnamed protein product [Rotaria magnacalcarata]